MSWRNTESTLKELERALSLNDYLCFFDTETTGLKPGRDKVIQIAGIKVDKEFNEIGTFNEYANPFPMIIPAKITEITGITNSDVEDARSEKEVLTDFMDFSDKSTYFAYNSNFDVNMVSKSLEGYGVPVSMEHIDVLKFAKDVLCDKKLENHKLRTVAEHLDVVPEENKFHDALFDVRMTISVFRALLKDVSKNGFVSSAGKECPKVWTLRPWDMGRNRRVYVTTSLGTLYYDKIKQVWGDKDAGIDNINMDYIEKICLQIAQRGGFKNLSSVSRELRA